MIIFRAVNLTNQKSYYTLALNADTFAAKARDVLRGGNTKFNTSYPTKEDREAGDLFKIEVLNINPPQEEINTLMIQYTSRDDNTYNGPWVSIFRETIANHYKPITLWKGEQNETLFQDFVEAFTIEVVHDVLYKYLYEGVSKASLLKEYEINESELQLMLKGLPLYINFINFQEI